jgi:hypothetical protein
MLQNKLVLNFKMVITFPSRGKTTAYVFSTKIPSQSKPPVAIKNRFETVSLKSIYGIHCFMSKFQIWRQCRQMEHL